MDGKIKSVWSNRAICSLLMLEAFPQDHTHSRRQKLKMIMAISLKNDNTVITTATAIIILLRVNKAE